jgi:DNA-binding transcriptional LysR family regulator
MVSQKETIEASLLRTFAEVAKRLSVTAAAEALGQPKSRVSKALGRLEAQLGVRLLERSTRRVALTPTGALLLQRADSIVAELERLAADVREQAESVRGIVRVTAPPELGMLLSERFFPALVARHPGLEVALELGYSFEDLLDPRFDLAVRLGSVHDERLVAHPVGGFSRIAVASAEYLKARPVRRVEDLAKCNCLAFSADELTAIWTLQKAGEVREVRVRGNFAAHSFTALLGAARAGLGVARAPAYAARDWLRRDELVRVLPGWSAPPTEVFVVHRFGHDRIRRVRAVMEACRSEVGPLLRG